MDTTGGEGFQCKQVVSLKIAVMIYVWEYLNEFLCIWCVCKGSWGNVSKWSCRTGDRLNLLHFIYKSAEFQINESRPKWASEWESEQMREPSVWVLYLARMMVFVGFFGSILRGFFVTVSTNVTLIISKSVIQPLCFLPCLCACAAHYQSCISQHILAAEQINEHGGHAEHISLLTGRICEWYDKGFSQVTL